VQLSCVGSKLRQILIVNGVVTKLTMSSNFRTFRALALTAIGTFLCCLAHAWGVEGHQVIATLAEQQLTAAARQEVARLLALEPGETLASVSTWADEHRNPQTAAWHYVNFPRGDCHYVAARDCPDGSCVVEALNRQIEVLGSSASDEVRLKALKYVVHFVGDVHQPLHAGYKDDRGGSAGRRQRSVSQKLPLRSSGRSRGNCQAARFAQA
jgi:hypothetical protein